MALSKESAVSMEVPTKGEIPDVGPPAGKPREFGDLLSAVAITAWSARDHVARWRWIASWKSQELATARNPAARHRKEPRPGIARDSVPSEFGRIFCWKNQERGDATRKGLLAGRVRKFGSS